MKFFSSILFTAIIILGISSCAKKENYSNIPAITFKNAIVYTPGDSLAIQINFTDGDGDIGYATGDTSAPYDCYLEYMIDTGHNGNYVTETTSNPIPKVTTGDTIVYPYLIPYITPTGSNKSLNGEIQIMIHSENWRYTVPPIANVGFNIEFKVWIIDRAGHVSNRIVTPPITVPST